MHAKAMQRTSPPDTRQAKVAEVSMLLVVRQLDEANEGEELSDPRGRNLFKTLGTPTNLRSRRGNLQYSGAMWPMVANMATRPCMSTIPRCRVNFST